MKKVSVFTVLTCFLAGTANLPCYAGNSWPWERPDPGNSKGLQTQPSTSIGRGRGRSMEPAQPLTPAGRGVGRGALPAQPLTSAGGGAALTQQPTTGLGRGAIPSTQPKPGPDDSQIPEFEGTFDDVGSTLSSPPKSEETPQMTAAEAVMVEQLIKDGKLPGIVLIQPASSHQAVPSAHGPVGGERAEQLLASIMPAPSSTTSSLVSGKDAEQSGIPSSRPTPLPTSSSLVLEEIELPHTSSSSPASFLRDKDDNALTHFVPSGAAIVQKENYRLAKVSLLCALIEWENFGEAAKNTNIRKLYEQKPEINIAQLNNGVKWAKFYLSKKGKEQRKIETANAFSQLIEARMAGLIKEVEESIALEEKPSVQIRFLQDRANDKILFSVQRNLGKIILVEIPGQE